MKKTYILAMVFGLALVLSAMPLAAAPVAGETVVIEVGKSYGSDYEAFIDKLGDWGYTVVEHNSTAGDYTSTVLSDADVLIMPYISSNLTAASITAIDTWFATGDKNLWVAGDSDYSDTEGEKAARCNAILEEVGSSIFVEATSIDSPTVNFGADYRLKATVYATTTEAAKILESAPHTAAEFHGTTAVIGKAANGTYIAIEDEQPADVEWVVKAAPSAIVDKESAASGSIYGIHEQGTEGSFVMLAVQTFTNGNKIVVSGENIFSSYKHMFEDPGEYSIPQDDAYIVYNTMLWFTGNARDTTAPKITGVTETTLTEANNFTEWTGSDSGSGICAYDIYLNDTLEIVQHHEYANYTYGGNGTVTFTVKARDYAANLGTVTTAPGFEFLMLLGSLGVLAIVIRRKN